jgi:hypothetical protein
MADAVIFNEKGAQIFLKKNYIFSIMERNHMNKKRTIPIVRKRPRLQAHGDSNAEPTALETATLPIELWACMHIIKD